MVLLKTSRDTYSAMEATKYSMTVREFIEELQTNCKMDDRIIFSNDGGYTYGYVNKDSIVITR